MNKHVVWLTITLCLNDGSALFAQPGGEGRWMNPQQRAEQQTAQMKEQLALSEAQAAKVLEINVKYAQQAQEARQKAEGDWEAMRAQMTTIRQAQDQELQTVLTEEQWQKWLTVREQLRDRRSSNAGGNPPTTPGKDKPAQDNKKTNAKKEKKSRSRGANPNSNR